jgi:hypothetical protein
MSKEIWLPISETKVTVVDGKVKTWDEMKMTPHSVSTPIGFQSAEEDDDAS